MVSFDGRTVLVTGGGRGIGRAACLAFAEHGADVVVNDVGGDAAGTGSDTRPADAVVADIRDAGGSAIADYSDVGTMDGADAAVATAYDRFDELDVVYNNAGILRETTLVSMTEAEFDDVIRVHLKGMFAVTHHAARRWRAAHKAGTERERAIVNASSDVAAGPFSEHASAYGLGNYAMAKAGILGLTRAAAEELGSYGVRVNAIWPAAATRLTESLPVDLPDPEPVAALVAYLASEACDISGQTLRIGGDRLDLVEPAPRTAATVYAAESAWTVDELADRFAASIGGHVERPG